LKSRKKTLYLFYGIISVFIFLFFFTKGGGTATNLYLICMGLGFGSGLSVLYITMSAEQFGTNLRATVAISVPNLVRGFLPLMILLFKFLRGEQVLNSYVNAAWVTGLIVIALGLWATLYTNETFGKDLNYTEK
jgi:MFS transporter, putative metabolite:H+ symporter